jgi:hypothetical protein
MSVAEASVWRLGPFQQTLDLARLGQIASTFAIGSAPRLAIVFTLSFSVSCQHWHADLILIKANKPRQ